MKGKTILGKTTAFMLVLVFSIGFAQMIPDKGITPVIQAKSIKKTRIQAEKAYMKKINALGEECGSPVEYKFVDITGDNVPEVLTKYIKKNRRHGNLDVYTYKKGKIKRILHIQNDNLKIYLYRKTKTLLVYDSYHDYRDCSFYQYSNKKMRLKAKKCTNTAGETLNWYENQNGRHISKKKYNRIVKKLKKGNRKNLDYRNWSGTYSETED